MYNIILSVMCNIILSVMCNIILSVHDVYHYIECDV